MTRLAYILALLLLSAAAAGQRAPVSVSAALTPPCSPSLSGVGARLIVSLHVNDATVVELPVRLHVRLEGAGVTIESVPSPSSPPLLLGGGEARVLTGDDLAPYLRLDNLSFRGLTKAAYRRGGHLPGGLWRLSVSVRHLHTGRPVSNVGAATAWLAVHGPPSLSSPLDGSAAPPDASSPLTFSWRACKLAGGAGPVMYRLEVWSLRSPGVPAQAVAASTPPLYSAETSGLSASVPAGALALEPGMRYCWRVTAYDPSGAASFENGGATEVRTFRYLEECPAARGLAAGPVDGRLAWEGDRAHTGGYDLELRSDDGAYHATLWSGEPRSAPVGGPPGRVWRARVRGVCRGRAEGAWSDWVQFAAPAAPAAPGRDGGAGRACGAEPPPRAVAATAPAGAVQEGDTLEDARGATRYVVRSASRNDDGSFRGLSYMLLRPWGVGALGEYDDMRVNSDGVILGRFSWRASRAGAGVVSPADVERWASEAALGIAGAAYSNAIRDTVDLSLCPGDVRFETIRRDGAGYFAVTRDGGEVDITPMVGGRARALVRDAEGHELVIDKDGEPMGVEEYRSCGGSAALLRESARSKDALVAGRGNVVFSAGGGARLDAYGAYAGHAAAAGYARRFPAVGAGAYRPAYACAGSGGEVLLTAEPHEGHTFRTGRGVPVPCRGGALSVTARGDRDTVSVYAYDAAGAVVGKVSVLSFDRVTRKVCLVPVGDARAPDAGAAKRGLDRIFAGLMVDFDVSVSDRVDIAYENGRRFTHGGSGAVGVYNADQRAAIAEVRSRGVDRETCYLFLVECGTGDQLDGLGRVRPVAGYMPRGFQFGFIYNQYDNWRAMAHELCHGAFHLAHTFAADDFLAPERSTDNLMDYGGGEALNHWQWAGLHRPGGVRFKWLQDEEGAESVVEAASALGRLEYALIKRCRDAALKGDGASRRAGEYVVVGKPSGGGPHVVMRVMVEDPLLSEYPDEGVVLFDGGRPARVCGFACPDTLDLCSVATLDGLGALTGRIDEAARACESEYASAILRALGAPPRLLAEYSLNGRHYRLVDGRARESALTDDDISRGMWEDGGAEQALRIGRDSGGVVQVMALGFRRGLELRGADWDGNAVGHTADLPRLAAGVMSAANKYLRRNGVTTFDKRPAVAPADAFPGGQAVELDGGATCLRLVLRGLDIVGGFLKDAEFEPGVYLADSRSEIRLPAIATGAAEAAARCVTDVTSLAGFAYDLMFDDDARREAAEGLRAIGGLVADDPPSLFPLLRDIALEEATGAGPGQYSEMLSEDTDAGRRRHLCSKVAVRTASTVLAGGKVVARLPEMSARLARRLSGAKLMRRLDLPGAEGGAAALKARVGRLSEDARAEFLDDFADADAGALGRLVGNPGLVDAWEVVRNAHAGDRKSVDLLERVDALRGLPGRAGLGFTDDAIAGLRGVFYGPGNVATVDFGEVLGTCGKFVRSVADNGIDVGNLPTVIGELSKGQSFTAGAEWTLRYIGLHGGEFAGRRLDFEVVEEVGDKVRRVDMVVTTEARGATERIFYEFKSVKEVPPAHFLEQFGKDLANPDVSDLSQIRWVFDGRKVSQEQLTNAINNVIDDLPNSLKEKWDLGSEQVRKQLLEIFRAE